MGKQKKEQKIVQIDLPERVDSFNLESFLVEIQSRLKVSKEAVTLNMNETRFVSLSFIKKLAQLAIEEQSSGRSVVLLNPCEKVKKQIGIFSDIKLFQIQRRPSMRGWPELGENADF
ncbi:hypothetical protein GW916_05500 [bacterium]|nr:hypothetical protein [bacterium]